MICILQIHNAGDKFIFLKKEDSKEFFDYGIHSGQHNVASKNSLLEILWTTILGLIIEEVRFLADLKIAKNIFLNIILN